MVKISLQFPNVSKRGPIEKKTVFLEAPYAVLGSKDNLSYRDVFAKNDNEADKEGFKQG